MRCAQSMILALRNFCICFYSDRREEPADLGKNFSLLPNVGVWRSPHFGQTNRLQEDFQRILQDPLQQSDLVSGNWYRKHNFFSFTVNQLFPGSIGTVLDYFIDPATGETIPWQNKVAAFTSSAPDTGGSTIVVPTADTVRLTFLQNNLVRNGHPVMFVGSAGE